MLRFINRVVNDSFIEKGFSSYNSTVLWFEYYKVWYKFIDSGITSPGSQEKVFYYIYQKAALMGKLVVIFHKITKVLYEPCSRQKS